jgi:hypothetical protein
MRELDVLAIEPDRISTRLHDHPFPAWLASLTRL